MISLECLGDSWCGGGSQIKYILSWLTQHFLESDLIKGI